jgi:hypothetical protein
MEKSKIDYVDQTTNAKSNLNFLTNSQNNSTNEKTNHQKNIIFKHCQVDTKEIKCPFEWWGKGEAMFHIVGLLAIKF